MMFGIMYWSKSLDELDENLSRLKNTNYEHKLDVVKFQQIDLTLADNRLKNKNPLFIGALNDIPIYPPKLNIYIKFNMVYLKFMQPIHQMEVMNRYLNVYLNFRDRHDFYYFF
jgi:hypothetical protein